MDSDVVISEDIEKFWALRDDKFAVMCVKHDHHPHDNTKLLGATQTPYEKKNWSSVMLMNCAKCKTLTPEHINTASGLELHRFHWLGDDALIGEIPASWNHLVDYSSGELKDQPCYITRKAARTLNPIKTLHGLTCGLMNAITWKR